MVFAFKKKIVVSSQVNFSLVAMETRNLVPSITLVKARFEKWDVVAMVTLAYNHDQCTTAILQITLFLINVQILTLANFWKYQTT